MFRVFSLFIFVVAALLFTPVAALAQAAPAAGAHPGARVYAAQKCLICHSIAGVGNKKLPLDGVGAKLTADEIREWITNPTAAAKKVNSTVKPPMRPSLKLSPADLDALVAYMMSLDKK